MASLSTRCTEGWALIGAVAISAACGAGPAPESAEVGGSSAPGGSDATGGAASGSGGVAGSGGAAGGAPLTTGGVATGGLAATGGAFGGLPTGGSDTATGGRSLASGGALTGGVSTGGAGTGALPLGGGGMETGGLPPATGGAGGAIPTGGTATGGSATGGASMGGDAPTGGAATGGNSSGGIAGAGGNHTVAPSNGCSVTSVTTGAAIDLTMNVPGQSTPREYRLSVPADAVPGEALPLVFVLNGVGGTGIQAQQFFQVETGHRAIFVYPTSLPNDEAGGSIAWDFSLNGVDVPFFDAMVSSIEDGYCVDTSRIFVLGASSGGIMSNMLGCFRGDVIRAIAPSSGMTWQQGGCQGDVAVMVICGEQDTFNPCDDAQNGGLSQTNVWVPLNGCTQQTSPSPIADLCEEFQGCRAEDPLLLCRHPGGHGWPTSSGDFWWQFFMGLD